MCEKCYYKGHYVRLLFSPVIKKQTTKPVIINEPAPIDIITIAVPIVE